MEELINFTDMHPLLKNKITGYRLVIDYCNNHPLIMRQFPEFDLAMVCFSGIVAAISALELQEFQVMTGQGIDPETARKTICSLATHIAAMTVIYADDARDDMLKKMVAYTYQSLRKCSDKRLLKNCRNIYGISSKYTGVLEKYGMLKETPDILLGSIELFNTVVPPPKNDQILANSYRKRFQFFIGEAEQVLKTRLDVMAKFIMVADREFYNGYSEIRQLYKKRMVMPAA
jgi:hypothetical protein